MESKYVYQKEAGESAYDYSYYLAERRLRFDMDPAQSDSTAGRGTTHRAGRSYALLLRENNTHTQNNLRLLISHFSPLL